MPTSGLPARQESSEQVGSALTTQRVQGHPIPSPCRPLRGRCRRQRGSASRSASVTVRGLASNQPSALPVSRCATAPPRGEPLGSDSVEHSMCSTGGRCRRRRGSAPWSAGVTVRGLASHQPSGLPLSRCATAPPRGERLGSDSVEHSMCSTGARCRRQRGSASRSAGVTMRGLASHQASALPLSRCATAPPRGEPLRGRFLAEAAVGGAAAAAALRRWLRGRRHLGAIVGRDDFEHLADALVEQP